MKRGPHNSTSAGFVKDASPSVGPPCACLLHQMWPEVPPPPLTLVLFFLFLLYCRPQPSEEFLEERSCPGLTLLSGPGPCCPQQPVSPAHGPCPTPSAAQWGSQSQTGLGLSQPSASVWPQRLRSSNGGSSACRTVLGAGQGLVRAAVMNVGRSPLSMAGEALDSGNYDVTGECFCHCRTHGLRLPVPTPSLPDLPPAPTLAPLFLNRSSRMGSLDSGPSVKRPSQLAR